MLVKEQIEEFTNSKLTIDPKQVENTRTKPNDSSNFRQEFQDLIKSVLQKEDYLVKDVEI